MHKKQTVNGLDEAQAAMKIKAGQQELECCIPACVFTLYSHLVHTKATKGYLFVKEV